MVRLLTITATTAPPSRDAGEEQVTGTVAERLEAAYADKASEDESVNIRKVCCAALRYGCCSSPPEVACAEQAAWVNSGVTNHRNPGDALPVVATDDVPRIFTALTSLYLQRRARQYMREGVRCYERSDGY